MSEIRVDTITEKTSGSGTTVSNLKNPNQPFRNLIVNGDMAIWQRYGGSAVTISDGSNEGYNSVDRWKMMFGSSAGGAVQWSRSTDVPAGAGFAYSLKVSPSTTTTASGNHEIAIQHFIEAQNIPDISYGTSSAKKLTLSFYFKTNKVGLYSVYFQHPGSGTAKRKFLTFTPAASGTWERITLTVTGDTAVAFPVNVNTYGLGIYIYLDNPPNYDVDATEADWQTSVVVASENNVNFMDNTSNELYLTGVQIEVGETATDFEHLPHDVQLQRCLRYFYGINGISADQTSIPSSGYVNVNNQVRVSILSPAPMRTFPTLTETGIEVNHGANQVHASSLTGSQDNVNASFSPSDIVCTFTADSGTPFTVGQSVILRLGSSTSNFIRLDSEL